MKADRPAKGAPHPGCGSQHPQRFACVLLAAAQPAPAGVKPFIKKHWKPITASDTYTVKPMVKGTVLTADFEVGDTVNKGDVRHLRFELPRDDAGRR